MKMKYRKRHKKIHEDFMSRKPNILDISLEKTEAIKEMRGMYDDVLALEGYFEGEIIFMNEKRTMEISFAKILVLSDTCLRRMKWLFKLRQPSHI